MPLPHKPSPADSLKTYPFKAWTFVGEVPTQFDACGYGNGFWGIHPSTQWDGTWTVSHLASGYATAPNLPWKTAVNLLLSLLPFTRFEIEMDGYKVIKMSGEDFAAVKRLSVKARSEAA